MTYEFRELNLNRLEDCKTLADCERRILADVSNSSVFYPTGYLDEELHSIEAIQRRHASREIEHSTESLIIEVGSGRAVGLCTLDINPAHLYSKMEHAVVAWPTIIVFDRSDRNRGLANLAIKYMFSLAEKCHVTHFEIGIFPHNTVMLEIFKAKVSNPVEISLDSRPMSRRFLLTIEEARVAVMGG